MYKNISCIRKLYSHTIRGDHGRATYAAILIGTGVIFTDRPSAHIPPRPSGVPLPSVFQCMEWGRLRARKYDVSWKHVAGRRDVGPVWGEGRDWKSRGIQSSCFQRQHCGPSHSYFQRHCVRFGCCHSCATHGHLMATCNPLARVFLTELLTALTDIGVCALLLLFIVPCCYLLLATTRCWCVLAT